MTFRFTYHRDKARKTKPVREGHLRNMGDWRSRWERKRDIDRRDPRKDRIERILTRPTDKDYIVREVHGTSPDNLFFKAVPIPDPPAPKRKGGRKVDTVEVRNADRCRDCGNYIRTAGKSKARRWPFGSPPKYSTTAKSKSKPRAPQKSKNSKKERKSK